MLSANESTGAALWQKKVCCYEFYCHPEIYLPMSTTDRLHPFLPNSTSSEGLSTWQKPTKQD